MSAVRRSPWPPVESSGESEGPPTVRLCTPEPHPLPHTPALTPPPSGDLKFNRRPAAAVESELNEPGVMPRPGDTFLGFRLVEELGRGAFARVFLAEQAILAGRQVAIKVTQRPTREAERLARLQHTNIVPVYSVHALPPVQVICMPFLGRHTIADLLRATQRASQSRPAATRRTGGTRQGGSTTIAGSGPSPELPNTLSGEPRPGRATEPDPAAAQVFGEVGRVLRLLQGVADGLAHAHDHGILHLDLKPANILLADSGEPMLLDFNLSVDTTRADRDMVGGTITYMAPEQLLDLRSRGHGAVDARTDLYALGVVAFEMFTGSPPFAASAAAMSNFDAMMALRRSGPPSIRDRNPAVTPAVEAMVRKLLAPDPRDRYQSAKEFRTDLERHRADQPLLFVREPSVRERLGKWRRRNPRLLGRFLLAGAIGLAGTLGGTARYQAIARAEAEAVTKARETHARLAALRLDLIAIDDAGSRPRGIERATEWLAGYGLPDDADWRSTAAFARLPEADRAKVAAELGELLLLTAHARWQDAQTRPEPERTAAAAEILAFTRAARGCFAPDRLPPLLVRQTTELCQVAGEEVPALESAGPTTARDHFLDAVSEMTAGRYSRAIPALDRAIGLQPDHAAAQFGLAFCRQQTGQYARAIERYEAARVLLPDDPRPFLQQGVIYGLQVRPAAAEREFTRAIEIDPDCAEAYRNRALARFRLRKHREAAADLTAALERGSRPLLIYPLRAHLRDELGEREGAEADRRAAQTHKPEWERDFLVRGLMRMKADPKAALADFRAAAERNPASLPALRNQVHVLCEYLNDPTAALAVADRTVALFPESAPARAGRAILLARLGKREEAHKEAERIQLLTEDAHVTYKLACVYALTSATNPEDREKSLALLRQAYLDGYREAATMAADPDLRSLRPLAEFADLIKAMKVLSPK